MASWLSALKLIPWSAVIAAAPTVAAGAKELWDARRASRRRDGKPGAVEEQIAELRQELAQASELIDLLVEQNRRWAEAVSALQAQVRRLAVVAVLTGVGLLGLAIVVALK